MKKALIISALLLSATISHSQNCKSFREGKWRIVYNPYYKKYAIMRTDSTASLQNQNEFLLKDHSGDYYVYSEGWDDKHCYTCGDRTTSLFDDPCQAKDFLIDYTRKRLLNKWK